MGLVGTLADSVGTREDALRLMLTILAGYPLAVIHRLFFAKQSKDVQHAFFITVGVSLYYWNYGIAIYHSLLSTLFAWLITNFLAGKKESIIAAHVAFLGHLLIGYWFAESAKYDITWTTPFCIMTLKYIGLVMEVYDGHNLKDTKPDLKKFAIQDKPTLIEIAAFGYFFTATFCGGHFPLQRFREFVNGDYLDEKTKDVRASSLMPSLGRFVAGVFYMVIHQWGAVWIPAPDYFSSEEYLNLPLLWRWTWVMLWFRLTMYRYVAAWLLNEGAAILAGVTYNGKDENGEDKWDGVRDLHIMQWEFGTDYSSVVASFNTGTNTFAKNHVFRRLRWLNSKVGAQAATLLYLAIWHGYHLGYFLLFAYEMMCMVAQDQLYAILNRIPGANELIAQKWFFPIKLIFARVVISYSMGCAFLTFGLIKKEIWWGPLKSLYGIGHIFYFIVWPIAFQKKEEGATNAATKETKKEL